MPNHVHLVICPRQEVYSVSEILLAIKQPVARKAIEYLKENSPAGLHLLATGQQSRPYHSWQKGGGLFCDNSRPTVTRCAFVGNSARYGGGICGDAAVSHYLFSNNSAYTGGGTWRVGTIAHCTFLGNTASMGGAVHSSQTVTGCTFIENEEGIIDLLAAG